FQQRQQHFTIRTNLLKEPGNTSAIAYSYPFFDQMSWSWSDDGSQIAKWSIHQDVTPKVDMKQFPWFVEATDRHRLFTLRAANQAQERLLRGGTADVYVEPLLSPNTGEYLTVLTKPFGNSPRPYVGLLIVPLSSVNSPVFPPGYGFAVIRADGTVLFSSN